MIRLARVNRVEPDLVQRPIRIRIEGLFGNSNEIAFDLPNADRNLVILTGPNGSGKSTVFSILSHLCEGSIHELAQIKFGRIIVIWDSTAELYVTRNLESPTTASLTFRVIPNDSELLIPDATWYFKLEYQELLPSAEEGIQDSTEAEDDLDCLEDSEGEQHVPDGLSDAQWQRWEDLHLEDSARKLGQLCRAIRTRYISTNRLATVRREEDHYETDEEFGSHDRVLQKSNWMVALASRYRFARASRRGRTALDILKSVRDFSDNQRELSEEEVESSLAQIATRCDAVHKIVPILQLNREINQFRAFLSENRSVLDSHRDVVRVMIEDLNAALEHPEAIATRITGLTRLANTILIGKHLTFDIQHGLRAFHNVTHAQITLNHLSSGEQHLLVLLVELMEEDLEQFAFEGPERRILLVDEPEISLHLAWQHAIRDELVRLSETGQRIIIATHSPEIIGDRWDCEEAMPYPAVRNENKTRGWP